MSARSKKRSAEWQHPIPISLLKQHKYEKHLTDIIDAESTTLLACLQKENPKVFSKEDIATPIEAIASALNIEVTSGHYPSSFLASVKQIGSKYHVAQNTSKPSYFRQRFSLAHEIGHLILSRAAGPLNFEELSKTNGTSHEEEAICDLFASALLMPKLAVEPYLKNATSVTSSLINNIAKDFRVSRSAALRRVAWLTNSILLLWDEIANPLRKGSPKAERITQVYPRLSQLSNYYIPLYCTPSDLRFTPNIILESFTKGISTYGIVEIKDMGSLPDRPYRIHNVFFQRWSENLISDGIVERPTQFFNMATFIEVNEVMQEEKLQVPYQMTLFD